MTRTQVVSSQKSKQGFGTLTRRNSLQSGKGEISLRPQKGPKRVDTNIADVKSFWFFNNTWENLLKGVEFRPEHFITDVSGKYPRLWALKGAAPTMFEDGTISEHSPQFVPLHQVSEKSQNYQTGFVMPSRNPGTTTPT
ncbi:hypothetical protein ACS0TY_010273 [Phlomoides rotata]